MTAERILIVDDGKEMREFLVEHVLQPNGFEALVARDGQEGYQMAMRYRPDLILLDLQMPRMNGFEVLQALAAAELHIPVILMTLHGSEEIAIEMHRLGVKDYVKKPYTPEEMLFAIHRALGEVRLLKEKEALTERVLQANRELQRRVQEMNVLYKIGKSVTELTLMKDLLPRIVEAAVQMTQAEEGFVYLQETNGLWCRAQKRLDNGRARPCDYEVTDSFTAGVIQQGRPLLLTPDELSKVKDCKFHSAAYTPMVFQNHVLGVLSVQNASMSSHVFSKHDLALLDTLSDYCAIAIENARSFAYVHQTQEHEKQQMRKTFEMFVPPSVVDIALSNPRDVRLGGMRQEITVLFADIRGYTAWSENAPPEKVMEMLNTYLSMAAEVILAWEGTLDKFFGDGLMAIFNAPKQHPDHLQRAADAALALLKVGDELKARHGYDLTYSIGVHVGEAVVGYIGNERALNYTAIGDVVNVAKRLQELAPAGKIYVEDAAVHRLKDKAQLEALGQVSIRGRKQPALVYELRGLVTT